LEPEHLDLLRQLADASRSLPRHRREFHLLRRTMGSDGTQSVIWDGGSMEVLGQDIYDLANAGLLRRTGEWVGGHLEFLVPPEAFDHLAELEAQAPMARIEQHIATYIEADEFKQRYPLAYQRWAEAAALLRGEDAAGELSTIGQREGEPLDWEDGRRAVFQTAIVMYEVDRTL
jgi:hypothetical protein